jgi:GNAT superfamily N-acetyltransferase
MVTITEIDGSRAEDIARLAVCLTNEIIERTGISHFDVDVPQAIRLCQDYLENGLYTVVAALDGDEIVGFGALCESHSLYAEGAFGIVQEFYVQPAYRSKGVGRQLIETLREVARQKSWTRLELCTPPVPEFKRTVAFYQDNGFEITGGYKMKCVLGE